MKLIDAFPGWLTNGIFHKLQSYDVPWKNEDISLVLDMEYFGNVSGEKLVSPLISKLLTGESLSDAQITQLAELLYGIYGPNWTKEWATLTAEYNPIENYHMIETMTDDETVTDYGKTSTRTDNLSHGKTGTEALQHGHTDTRTDNLTHEKTGTEALQHGHTDTRTDNLTHAKTGTEALQHGHTDTRTDNLTHAKTGTESLLHGHTDTRTDNLTHGKTGTETVRDVISSDSVDNTVYGFNSASAVGQSGSDHTKDGTNTTTYNLSETETGTSTHANTGTDTTTYNLSETETGTSTHANTGTDTTTYNLSETETGTSTHANTGTDTTTYNLSETETGTSTHANTGTDTTTYNLSETDTGTVGNVDSGSDTTTRNYELERSGNIGVTTSQQMLQSERDLWLWNYFYKVVFPDVDRVLTIPYYSSKPIETGSGFTPTGTLTITENGLVNVYNYASADVNVPNTYAAADEGKVVVDSELVTQSIRAIVANGGYDTTTNKQVIVDVPNTYTSADEGKVVSSGELVSQTSRIITSNGVYDTTLNDYVSVELPGGLDTGLLPFSDTQKILQSCLSGDYSIPKNNIDLSSVNVNCTIYGILKKYPENASGDLVLLSVSYGNAAGYAPCFFTRNNQLWVSVYGSGGDRYTGYSALSENCIAFSCNQSTKKVRYFVNGNYVDENSFVASGQYAFYANCEIFFFGVVLECEDDAIIINNLNHLLDII